MVLSLLLVLAQAEGARSLELPTVEQFLDEVPQEASESKGFFEEVGDTIWDLGKTFVLDMGYLLTTPLRPTKEGFLTFVGGVALIGVTMAVLDEPIRGFAQRNRHEDLDKTLGILQDAMSRPAETGIGIAALGLLISDPHLARTGLEVVETDFATGILTSVGKRVFGRSRPGTERGAHSFKFFGGTEEGRRSFPSGAAQQAFSIAVPIAEEYPDTVWPYVIYPLASLASIQRVVADGHWTSDILASALLSVAVGKALVWLHRQDPTPPLVPWLAGDAGSRVMGVAVERRF
jgi:membrane-associated phospholipid phosphatase